MSNFKAWTTYNNYLDSLCGTNVFFKTKGENFEWQHAKPQFVFSGNPLDESDCKMSDAVADPFLVSLGFEEKDCIEALMQTNGNVSEAAVWLTDNRALGGQQEVPVFYDIL